VLSASKKYCVMLVKLHKNKVLLGIKPCQYRIKLLTFWRLPLSVLSGTDVLNDTYWPLYI
jgi:hypothetical protein